GYDVGVVVVGETPYAEGVGDVGNGHTLQLSAADQAAVDKVCAAMKCAVLIVSGRPQLIGDRLGAIDALVASWLPGTEGDAVADAVAEKAGADEAGRALVTKARLIVQRKVGADITAANAKPFADADHLSLTGHYRAAVDKLTEAYRAA